MESDRKSLGHPWAMMLNFWRPFANAVCSILASTTDLYKEVLYIYSTAVWNRALNVFVQLQHVSWNLTKGCANRLRTSSPKHHVFSCSNGAIRYEFSRSHGSSFSLLKGVYLYEIAL